ncbi:MULTISPECIES: hypothetical protein [unclassified Synechocystis]|uniref:hypothetical protein n=1 Tax=unclassified Synechocystis TaxID=2640012 RepID=UPI00048BAF8E|nr:MULTISPECIES: hypothetical protein [unclassified Synechocystis]MCT0254952.1 hypothetical protein [Synechocystis sp. CS-94]
MPMSSLISLFRQYYPQGSLCCDLLEIDRGLYIVQASITLDGVVVATALAAQSPLEAAEDLAKERAIASLDLTHTSSTVPQSTQTAIVGDIEAKPSTPPSPPKKESKSPKQNHKAVTPTPVTPVPTPVVEKSAEAEAIAAPEPTLTPAPISFPPSPDPVIPLEETGPPLEEKTFNSPTDLSPLESEPAIEFAPQATSESAELPLSFTTEAEPKFTEPAMASVGATDLPEGPMDFSEIIARSNLELKRLGWTSDQGRNYLLQTYGKRSRQLLSDEQLIEFLAYLEQQPDPN